ncbi:MAG: hypothetical protein RL358_524 [Pseudomonadota bacterium]|jgi:hypothetical protein
MFHTHSSSELELPPGLAPHGTRSWYWVELPLQLPYFCVSIGIDGKEGLRRQFIVDHIKDVLTLLSTQAEKNTINHEVGLISPGYMNGTDFYKMGRIKEAWESSDGHKYKYVMEDGTNLYDLTMGGGGVDQNFELILSL